MTPDIDAIRERAEAATAGEWETGGKSHGLISEANNPVEGNP